MKKKILTLMVGVLLIAVNLYAAGDLIVEGNAGIGTTTPATTLDVRGNITILAGSDIRPTANSTTAINIAQADGTDFAIFNTTNKRFKVDSPISQGASISGGALLTTGSLAGGYFSINKANTAVDSSVVYGLNATALHTGSANLTGTTPAGLLGGRYQAWAQSSGVTISKAMALFTQVNITGSNTATITDAYDMFFDPISAGSAGTIVNAYGLYLRAHTKSGTAVMNNAYSAWFEKQTAGGITNMGIVLDGDGAGSDIVFGPNQEASIYSNTGELFAKDGAGNVTQISPHDPETGEWIFYSKNVKTGKVVRVDMEKLVKAVERLTGEKFMVETIGER